MPTGPEADLIPEDPKSPGPARTHSALGHDATLPTAPVVDRGLLDHEVPLRDLDLERGVVQVARGTPFETRREPLVDATVQPDEAPARPERQPVQIDGGLRLTGGVAGVSLRGAHIDEYRSYSALDRFADAQGSMDVRLAGRFPLIHAADEDTTRSGAGRVAAEAIWTPASLLPDRGLRWRAESKEIIVATLEVPLERPELHLRIDADGAIRNAWVMRWDNGRHGKRGYIPCGAHVLAQRRFGAITIPSRLSAGWWFDTPRYAPFLEAEILVAEPLE
jgi:hypothetical protein